MSKMQLVLHGQVYLHLLTCLRRGMHPPACSLFARLHHAPGTLLGVRDRMVPSAKELAF